jgi:hypothetical protein
MNFEYILCNQQQKKPTSTDKNKLKSEKTRKSL